MSYEDLTEQQIEDLLAFSNQEAGWSNETTLDLIRLALIDYEESYDGTGFWLTELGRDIVDEIDEARNL